LVKRVEPSSILSLRSGQALTTKVEHRSDWVLLAGILLLAALLRIGWPTLTEFKFSEARLEALSLELTREGRLPLVGVPSSAGFDHSPISVYLYVPAFLFTSHPIPATIYGGLVGVTAVALCWWLARRWPKGGRWAAMIAALLFAVSPWMVAFSRKIWQVTFVPLLALIFLALVVSALIEGANSSPPEGRQWHLAWAVVVFALLVQVHPSALSLAPALLLWLIVFRRRVRVVPLLVGGAIGILTAAPFLVHQSQGEWPVLGALGTLQKASWDLAAVRLTWETITGRSIHALAGRAYPLLKTVPQLGWVFNFVGWLTVGSALGLLWRIVKDWRAQGTESRQAARIDLVLLCWLIVPVVFSLRHGLDLYLHFFALVAPAAYLMIGRASEAFLGKVQASASRLAHPLSLRSGQALVIACATAFGLLAVAQASSLVLMARFVASHDTPGGFGTPLARYLDIVEQTSRIARTADAAEVLVVGQGDSTVVDQGPAVFDVLLRDKIAYRFVDGHSTAVFPPNKAIVLLAPEPGDAARWYGAWPAQELGDGYRLVVLDATWPVDDLRPVTGTRVFENGVEIQSYAWEPADEDSGQFWLLWQVLWLSSDDTHFFVNFLDEEQQLWGQQDSVGYPREYRRKGDRILSKFDITRKEQAGTNPYWARAGLYLYPQIVNVPVIDDSGDPIGDAVNMGLLAGEQ
jgi:hypothetical protein